MNKEIIATIKNVKNADELKEVASKNGYNLSDKEAQGYFDLYHSNGQVNDNELDNVTGGSTCINGRYYSDDPEGYLIVTVGNVCDSFREDKEGLGIGTNCGHCFHRIGEGFVSYCTIRYKHDDPYNKAIGTKRDPGYDGKYH